MRTRWIAAAALAGLAVWLTPVRTDGQATTKTTLYLVATAHLDTQWNWTVQDSIRDYIPNTFRTNFEFFEKYPNYKFSWEGAIHYMWFKEYYPLEWAKLQQYVAADRWRLAGSWLDAVDGNMPAPESLFRQALYGQRFFKQEFNKVSRDIYLPDCFGFPFSLPTIAAHSGLTSFSTQKLTWGRPIPFPIGRWKGVDGSEIIAELNPGSYTTRVLEDITLTSPNTGATGRQGGTPWLADATPVGGGQAIAFKYFGTGDVGGGPSEASVQFVQKALTSPDPKLEIKNTSPDQLAKDLTPEQRAALPVYDSELILKTHGTGCYTSQAAMKRFNRTNELLADAAERAGVAAQYVAGATYPTERLRDAWVRFLWHQFHDDLTGTCIPQAYQFSWNDEIISMNQFAGVLTSATSAMASLMDTSGTGTPLVVYNPISMDRREPVEATVTLAAPTAAVKIVDPATGETMPSQVLSTNGREVRVLFLASAPSVGYKVYLVSPAAAPGVPPALKVTSTSLENNRIAVKIDANGDISSIYDKDAKHELLSAPIMLELRDNPSTVWPAWEVLFETVRSPAREWAADPVIKIVERGPVRVALEITRKASGSTFVQRVSLAAGGDRVDVLTDADWRSTNSQLKASFPFTARNPKATYDIGLGTIDRTNNEADKYEVPGQKWANIDDVSGTYGVGVLNDSKYGWDKPNDHTLRLSLLHTPRPAGSYSYQSSNDLGKHRFAYSVVGHAGDWRQGRMPTRATQFNQPLVAFQTTAHAGVLGRSFSMVSTNDTTGQVSIVAMKKAEDSDEVILRLQERYGMPTGNVTVRMGVPMLAAREVNAAEEEVGPFALAGGRGGGGTGGTSTFTIALKAYQPRAVALKLVPAWVAAENARTAAAAAAAAPPGAGRGGGGGRGNANPPPNVPAPKPLTAATVELPFNLDGVSTDAARTDGDFDGKKHTIAAELLPQKLDLNGVPFAFGSGAAGAKNVLVPKGQSLALPAGTFNRAYVLASAVGGDVATTIGVGTVSHAFTVREWEGPVGQWWSRLKDNGPALREPFVPVHGRGNPQPFEIQDGLVVAYDQPTGIVTGIDKIRPAFAKRDEIAWMGTHRHDPNGNEPYVSSYLFVYAIDLPAGTRTLRLPSDDRLRIMAVTVTSETDRAVPAGPLYMPDFPENPPPRPRPVVPPARVSGSGRR